jgi:hypothetical protein
VAGAALSPSLVAADEEARRLLEQASIRTVQGLLARAAPVRALDDRANLSLRLGDRVLHVKVSRRYAGPPAAPPEAAGIGHARAAGVPTASVAFVGADPAVGGVTGTWDLAPARPLDDLLERARLPATLRARLVQDLARAVARLHDAGWHHRDLYLNHVFVDPLADAPLAAVIDWDRIGAHRHAYGRWVVKDLASLEASAAPGLVSARERMRFLRAYLAHRGGLPRAARRRLAGRVRRKARRIRAHRPRTPVGEAARAP